jgi:hypothetical protein
MGLDIYFYKQGFDIQKKKDELDAKYTKFQAAKEELEQVQDEYESAKLFSADVTHNLNEMAKAVGLYEVLWRAEEIGITVAS